MKKLLLTLSLTIALGLCANAQRDSFFTCNANDEDDVYRNVEGFELPNAHGTGNDFNSVPVGSGLLILTALGAGYMVSRHRK